MSYAEALYASIDAGIISRWVEARQEEHLHLDFKQATARPKDDRINFAIALSAFANADGGIIVWGVKTERASGVDVAAGVSPITPLSQFVASLNDFTGQAVNPLVDGVVHKVIETDKPDTGFVVTLIPSSDSGPHMAKLGEDRYYKRSGSRFAKMEHYEVADMFGRRQRPLLNLNYRVSKIAQTLIRGAVISQSTTITLSLSNSGRGSAKAPFLDIAYPTGLYSIDLVKPIRSGVSGSLVKPLFVDNSRRQFVGFADFVIHPGVGFDVVELMPIGFPDSDLVLDCSFAAENYHLENLIIKIPKQEIVYVPSQ